MSSDDERIDCKKCGSDTNHCPPEFPPEWDGYCPTCAMSEALAGIIPKCSLTAILGQVEGKLRAVLGDDIEIGVMSGDDIPVGAMVKIDEDDNGATYLTRQCLN